MNKNNAFIGLCLGLSMAFQVHAQKPVAAPMKDVNQVIDNTLDSLNTFGKDSQKFFKV